MSARLLPIALFLATPALAEEQVSLKPGAGRDDVATACSVCHTLDYIRMNSTFLSPEAWKAEVTKMRDAYGAPIDDAAADSIIKYLSTTYSVQPKS
jgi:mono/diheme cytochrome c family protein